MGFCLLIHTDSNPRVIATTNIIQKYKLQLRSHKSSRYRPIKLSHRIMRELRVLSPRQYYITQRKFFYPIANRFAVGFLCCCSTRTQNPLCFAKRNIIEFALPPNVIIAPHYARTAGSESPTIRTFSYIVIDTTLNLCYNNLIFHTSYAQCKVH